MRRFIAAAATLAFGAALAGQGASASTAIEYGPNPNHAQRTTPVHGVAPHCQQGRKLCGHDCIPKGKACHKAHPCGFNQVCGSKLPHL